MVKHMLNDEQLKEELPHLERIAKAQDIDLAEVVKTFAAAMAKIEENPKNAGKPLKMIINRTYSLMDMIFNNIKKKGEAFIYIPFGPLGETKDWNDDEFKQIAADILRNKGISKLMKDGKIMTKKNPADGTDIPLSRVTKYEMVKRYVKGNEILIEKPETDAKEINVMIVTEGDEWKEGEGSPMFRDSRLYNNANVNFDYSKPLRHRWELVLVGLAWAKENAEDARLFEARVKSDQADPESDKFYFKHYQMFKAYTDNFETDVKSTAWKFVLDTSSLSSKSANYDTSDIDEKISNLFAYFHDKFGAEAAKKGDEIPVFIKGMVGIPAFHQQAVKRDKGNVIKSETGWDVMKWNKYAIISCSMQSIKEPVRRMKFPMYTIFDSEVNRRMNVFSTRYVYNQPQVPAPVLMMIKTGRKPERYDPLTHTNVRDTENGDISLTAYSLATVSDQVKIEDIKMYGAEL